MGLRKFLLIPVLVILYLTIGITFLMRFNIGVGNEADLNPYSTGEQIGMGEKVVISVTRPYLLGLIRLPIHSEAIGDISWVHHMFFTFIGVMTVAFAFMEFSGFQIKLKDKAVSQNSGGSGVQTDLQTEIQTMDIHTYQEKGHQEKMVNSQRTRKKEIRGNENMAIKWDWKGWLMALGKGILFGLIAYIIGGNGALGVGLGLLVTYLEMKLK